MSIQEILESAGLPAQRGVYTGRDKPDAYYTFLRLLGTPAVNADDEEKERREMYRVTLFHKGDFEAQLDKKILEDGVEVPGFKAVLGRMGNREWRDKKEVETTLTQSMKLKHEIIYNKVIKSPTALEKHAKSGEIGPRQWKTLQDMITRSEAKLKVALESDERPAVLVAGDHLADFEAVE